VARRGLLAMIPALRQAFDARRDNDRLDKLFGPSPRLTMVGITLSGILIGYGLQDALAGLLFVDYIHIPAALLGAIYALLYRRYLFGDFNAGQNDFPWLAGALILPAVALVTVAFIVRAATGFEALDGAPGWTVIGEILDAIADSMSVAAGLTIAVAALCYSKAWSRAIKALVWRLLVFKIIVWFMILVFVEIGIVGPILGALVEGLLGVDLPNWLGDFADQLSYALLILIIYLAIIGGTWTACSRSFSKLLAQGEVDVLQELETMAESPSKRRNRARKARATAKKKAGNGKSA